MINIDRNHGVIRYYNKDKSFENKDPFKASLNFLLLSDKVVYCYNMIGKLDNTFFDELKVEFESMGLKIVIAYFPTKWKPKSFNKMFFDLSYRYI